MKGTYTICHELAELKHLDLYVVGSEGTSVCQQCEMDLVNLIRMMRLLAGRAVKMGYYMAQQRGKEGV